MMSFLLSVLSTDLGQYIAGALALAIGALGFRMKSVADGRADERAAQTARDLETQRSVSDAKDRMAGEIARDTDADGTVDRLRRGGF